MARTRLGRQAAVAEVPPAIEEPADDLLNPEDDEQVPLPIAAAAEPAVRVMPDGFPNPRAMTVWEYMQALTTAQWEQHMLYLYRKDPAPDKVAGEAAYLEKMAQPLDIDQVRQRWGGRKFHFYLNRMKSDGSGEYTVYRKTFAIDAAPKHSDPTKDAALQMPANGGGPESGQALKLVGDLLRDLIRQRDTAMQQGQKFDMSQAVTQAFSIMGNGANQAINIMAEQMKTALATAPGKQSELTQFKSFLELFREMQGPAASPLGQLKDLLDISRELRELEPAAGRGGGFLETLATQIAPQLGTLLDKVVLITSNIAGARSPAGAPPVRVLPGPAAIGAPGPQPQPGPAAQPQPPAPGANPAGPSQEQQIAEYQRAVIVEAIKRRIAAKAEAGSRTTPDVMQDEGAAAAELANEMDASFARLLEKTMRENPVAIAYDPILGACQRLPMIDKFIEGYLEFFAEEEPGLAAAGAEVRPN